MMTFQTTPPDTLMAPYIYEHPKTYQWPPKILMGPTHTNSSQKHLGQTSIQDKAPMPTSNM